MSTYLITGASRGIGLELVHQLSSHPTNTVIATVRSLSRDLLNLQEQAPNVRVLTCDVSSVDSIASLGTWLPTVLPPGTQITHLINNAAVLAHPDVKAVSMTADALAENITTNVLGPAKVVEAVLPFLAPGALIINTTSGIASLQLVSDGTIPSCIAAYSISKCALNMLTVHQAQELKGRCRVVCLDPGHVKTRMGGDKASVEIGDSVKGILAKAEELGRDEEGDMERGRARFVNFRGEEVPW